MKRTIRLTPSERLRIRALSGLADETCRSIERGDNVQNASLMRFQRAALEEGIDITPRRAESRAS